MDVTRLVEPLRMAVEHRVSEEETKAFPLMRDSMADDLESLGSEVERRKQELQNTR